MNTYTITITGTFEADTEAEALVAFEEWLMQRHTIQDGAVVTVDPA